MHALFRSSVSFLHSTYLPLLMNLRGLSEKEFRLLFHPSILHPTPCTWKQHCLLMMGFPGKARTYRVYGIHFTAEIKEFHEAEVFVSGSSMRAIWCVLNLIFMKAEPWVTLKIHFSESCISLKSHRHLYT